MTCPPDAPATMSDTGSGAATGAAAGGVLGGAAGLVVGLMGLAIPGIGPIVAAGPLAAALAGAGVGAVAGGLIGGLTGAGVSEEDANYYAESVRRGGALVTVRADDARADEAARIMRSHGAVDIERRAEQWREAGWTRHDPAAEPYSVEQMERERAVYSGSLGVTAGENVGTAAQMRGSTAGLPPTNAFARLGRPTRLLPHAPRRDVRRYRRVRRIRAGVSPWLGRRQQRTLPRPRVERHRAGPAQRLGTALSGRRRVGALQGRGAPRLGAHVGRGRIRDPGRLRSRRPLTTGHEGGARRPRLSMKPDDKSRKVVGVYDRPAGADRKREPWIWIVLVALLITLAWFAYFEFSRG